MDDKPADELERLLAQMVPVEPPADFLRNVLRQTRGEPGRATSRIGWLYACVYVAAMLALVLLAYGLGMAIGHNGTSTLISELLADATLFADAPESYVSAILTSLPWLQIGAVVFDLALVIVVTQIIVSGPRRTSAMDGFGS